MIMATKVVTKADLKGGKSFLKLLFVLFLIWFIDLKKNNFESNNYN